MSKSEQNRQQHTFSASATQSKVMNSTAKQLMVYGGFGSGKTTTLNEKIFRVGMKYPGSRALIVRQKFSDVQSSTIEQSLLENVIPDSHIPEGGYNKTSHKIEYYTGTRDEYGEPITSEIYFEGLDSSESGVDDDLPRRISGMQFSMIGIDEATETTEDDYVQLLGRLRYDGPTVNNKKYKIPFRQIIVSTNPGPPSHYLYERFRPDDPEKGVGECYHLRPEENPGIPDDYVEQLHENYSGVFYERYVLGKWVGASDVIYDGFDRRENVVSLEELREVDSRWTVSAYDARTTGLAQPPADWDVYRSIDFGYPSPMVVHWWAVSPQRDDGKRLWVLFREFYQSETMIDEVAETIQQYSSDIDVKQTFVDHAQADNRHELQSRGIEVTNADKAVWEGIQRVKGRMEAGYDNLPGVVFVEDSLINSPDQSLEEKNSPVRTVDEVGAYQWKNGKDEPVKEDDHGMDAMRYAIFSVEGDSAGSELSLEEMEELEEMFNSGF